MSLLDHRGEKKTHIPLAWLHNNQERMFFSASSVMLHITRVCWVSASIVPVKEAPTKSPASLHFKAQNRINPQCFGAD